MLEGYLALYLAPELERWLLKLSRRPLQETWVREVGGIDALELVEKRVELVEEKVQF